jgi:pilus assembly protein FimV
LGKSLEDYEAVVPRLTQAWPRPLDAMAELEALLFRKSRGELFDLPAYRDVLFLYALARDLMDREPSENNPVDLLLPLDAASRAAQHAEGGGGSSGVGNSRASSDMPIDDHPTSPLDLDLTPARSQESIFGEPLQPTPGVRRNGGPSRY